MSVCLLFRKEHMTLLSIFKKMCGLLGGATEYLGSEGPKYRQRPTDNPDLEVPGVALSCGALCCHRYPFFPVVLPCSFLWVSP